MLKIVGLVGAEHSASLVGFMDGAISLGGSRIALDRCPNSPDPKQGDIELTLHTNIEPLVLDGQKSR